MKIEINIDDRLVASTKRVFSRRNLAAVCMLGLLGSVAVYAAPVTVPNEFKADTVISADAVNANFQAMANASVLEANGKRYGWHGSFCGVTGSLNGARGGYLGAKASCELVTGCGDTSHVCTSEEMLAHVTTGGALPDGTYRVECGARSDETAGVAGADCDGLHSSQDTSNSSVWDFPAARPSYTRCDVAIPLACCQ